MRIVRSILCLLVVLFIGAVICFLIFRSKYQTVITALAQTQVKNATSDLINDAIDKQISNGNIQYDRMVYFEKDLEGKITALKTNMSEVNRLKTDLLNLINDEILAIDSDHLGIPLGSLILPEVFAGKGSLEPKNPSPHPSKKAVLDITGCRKIGNVPVEREETGKILRGNHF